MEKAANRSFLARTNEALSAFVESVFDGAARSIIRFRLGRMDIDQRVLKTIVEETSVSTKEIIEVAKKKMEEHFLAMLKRAIDEAVAERQAFHPIDSIIRNQIDAALAPQIGSLVEAAVRDARNNLDRNIVTALRGAIEEKVGDERLLSLLREAVQSVAKALPNKAERHDIPSREVATTERTLQHKQFERIFAIVNRQPKAGSEDILGSKVLMVGPAGSGKTLIAEGVAVRKGLAFYFNGPLQSEYKLTGYKDANGRYHYTPFRQAFENGGVYLFDELDACSAQALVAFNTALSNRICDFPDRVVKQHPNFICLAAANTHGQGGTATYAGRERIDGATLDRFVIVDVEYDEDLEVRAAGDRDWVRRVQQIRRAAATIDPRHIISMRASIEGARLLAKGVPLADVEKAVIWRGRLSASQIAEIKKSASL